RDAQRAARLALQRARRLLARFGLGEDLRAMPVVGSARLGHREAPRRAVQQANAQTLLQPLDMGANRRLRDLQPTSGGREAAAVDDAGKGGDAVERIHWSDCPEIRTDCP